MDLRSQGITLGRPGRPATDRHVQVVDVNCRQAGGVQLHRGIAARGVFLNHAVWASVEAFRNGFGDPKFEEIFARYPDSTVASPHLFQKVAVPGICVDR